MNKKTFQKRWYTKRSAEQPYSENNDQRKRCKRHFADVSVNSCYHHQCISNPVDCSGLQMH